MSLIEAAKLRLNKQLTQNAVKMFFLIEPEIILSIRIWNKMQNSLLSLIFNDRPKLRKPDSRQTLVRTDIQTDRQQR